MTRGRRTIASLLAVIAVLLALNLLVKRTSVAVAQGGPINDCCLIDGTCVPSVTVTECNKLGGIFTNGCANCQPPGACCFFDGTCTDTLEQFCSQMGGRFQGFGSTCPDICEPFGACCDPISGSCSQPFKSVCLGMGGEYQGDGTTECAPDTVCEVMGACCNPGSGTCNLTIEPSCATQAEWKGPDTNCFDNDFNGNPDVCENTCPPDLNGDGFVDITDLFTMFAQWGSCP